MMALPIPRALALAAVLAAAGCKPSRHAAVDPRGRQEVTMTNQALPDAQTLRTMALRAMPKPHLVPRLSPLLPDRWPDPAGAVHWLVYAEEVLPTGGIATRLQGPVAKIALRLPGGKPQVERIEGVPVAVLGTEYEGLPPPSLDSAEAALVQVALGRSDAGAAKADLKAYLAWADASPILGPDVRARQADFFRWLAAP
jgi:hypothetical protein